MRLGELLRHRSCRLLDRRTGRLGTHRIGRAGNRSRGGLGWRGHRHRSGHRMRLAATTVGRAVSRAATVVANPLTASGIGIPAIAGVHRIALVATRMEQLRQATAESAATRTTTPPEPAAAQFPAARIAGADTGRQAAAPHRREHEEQAGAQAGEQLHDKTFGDRTDGERTTQCWVICPKDRPLNLVNFTDYCDFSDCERISGNS